MESLYLKTAPPLDLEWLKYEEEAGLNNPKQVYASPLDRQLAYAESCRALSAKMTAPGARDHHLSQGIKTTAMIVRSSVDRFAIPVLEYNVDPMSTPSVVVVYIHGGGLCIGEADSEDLSCRRIVKELPELLTTSGGGGGGDGSVILYSIGYRLMPLHPARICVSDCADALAHIAAGRFGTPRDAKLLLVGSSSGGELAALVSQQAPTAVAGVVLRAPVTSDAFGGMEYVPERLRGLHTSAWEPSFLNSLLGRMDREVPRDGLEYMPLEAPEEVLRVLPRTWMQVCTNDGLYSDGICYAKALEDAGVEVKVDVVRGWPHTFWLKAPQLPRALEAEKAMLNGLAWVAE